jgi:hypothetical protein
MARSAYDLDSPREDQRGSCTDWDPEMWVLLGNQLTTDNQVALRICSTCPVKSKCLQQGVESGEKDMIYGGEVLPLGRRDIRVPDCDGRVTVAEVAQTLGVCTATVSNWCLAGLLPGEKTPRGWLIEPREVEKLRRDRR